MARHVCTQLRQFESYFLEPRRRRRRGGGVACRPLLMPGTCFLHQAGCGPAGELPPPDVHALKQEEYQDHREIKGKANAQLEEQARCQVEVVEWLTHLWVVSQ